MVVLSFALDVVVVVVVVDEPCELAKRTQNTTQQADAVQRLVGRPMAIVMLRSKQ